MKMTTRPDGVTVIDDSDTAAPDSMRAGLGDDAISEHDRIGRLAVRLDVSRLVVVGTGRSMRAMHHAAVMEGFWGGPENAPAAVVDDRDAALELLRAELTSGDVVLVKGSAGLGALAQALVAR